MSPNFHLDFQNLQPFAYRTAQKNKVSTTCHANYLMTYATKQYRQQSIILGFLKLNLRDIAPSFSNQLQSQDQWVRDSMYRNLGMPESL